MSSFFEEPPTHYAQMWNGTEWETADCPLYGGFDADARENALAFFGAYFLDSDVRIVDADTGAVLLVIWRKDA